MKVKESGISESSILNNVVFFHENQSAGILLHMHYYNPCDIHYSASVMYVTSIVVVL